MVKLKEQEEIEDAMVAMLEEEMAILQAMARHAVAKRNGYGLEIHDHIRPDSPWINPKTGEVLDKVLAQQELEQVKRLMETCREDQDRRIMGKDRRK